MTALRISPMGLGIGWRPELALSIDRRRDLGFVEVVAEDIAADAPLPEPIEQLRRRGVVVIPHGITLSLGGAEPLDHRRLEHLARLAEQVSAPLVSEHLAFVRAGNHETGHLLPLPRTREAVDIVVENVRQAQCALPVPIALENIATHFQWPKPELDETAFVTEILERTDALLLLDLENLFANVWNHGGDALEFFDQLPLDRIAYVHVAGGIERDGVYHDTHAHDVPAGVLDLVSELCARVPVPGIMLERDDDFPSPDDLNGELDRIAAAMTCGAERRLSQNRESQFGTALRS